MSLLRSFLLVLACVVLVALVSCATQGEVTPQVIGGDDSEIKPYLASVRNPSYSHVCGAAIIKTEWVLTCAHCTMPSTQATYVVAGTNNTTGGGWLYTITKITSHSNFDNALGRDDISAIRVYPPFITGSTIAIIAIRTVPSVGSDVDMAGFGWTSYPGGTVSPDLQTVTMTVYSSTQCRSDLRFIMTVYPENFCFKGQNGEAICYGDSGSPVTYLGKLIGLAQRVANGCGKDKPDR